VIEVAPVELQELNILQAPDLCLVEQGKVRAKVFVLDDKLLSFEVREVLGEDIVRLHSRQFHYA